MTEYDNEHQVEYQRKYMSMLLEKPNPRLGFLKAFLSDSEIQLVADQTQFFLVEFWEGPAEQLQRFFDYLSNVGVDDQLQIDLFVVTSMSFFGIKNFKDDEFEYNKTQNGDRVYEDYLNYPNLIRLLKNINTVKGKGLGRLFNSVSFELLPSKKDEGISSSLNFSSKECIRVLEFALYKLYDSNKGYFGHSDGDNLDYTLPETRNYSQEFYDNHGNFLEFKSCDDKACLPCNNDYSSEDIHERLRIHSASSSILSELTKVASVEKGIINKKIIAHRMLLVQSFKPLLFLLKEIPEFNRGRGYVTKDIKEFFVFLFNLKDLFNSVWGKEKFQNRFPKKSKPSSELRINDDYELREEEIREYKTKRIADLLGEIRKS